MLNKRNKKDKQKETNTMIDIMFAYSLLLLLNIVYLNNDIANVQL